MNFRDFRHRLLINLGRLGAALFPPECVGCQKGGFDLCPECRGNVPPTQNPNDWVIAAVPYHDERIKKLIWRIKYHGAYQATETLAEILSERLLIDLADWFEITPGQRIFVAPVPASDSHRGFNQAKLIAQALVRDFSELLDYADVLEKVRATPSQMSLPRSARLTNLIGAFAVKPGTDITGKKFLIIDDVATTGSTMAEARRALEERGANVLAGAVVAHG